MDTSIDYLPSSVGGADGQHFECFVDREKLNENLKQSNDEFGYNMIKCFLKTAQTCEKDLQIAMQNTDQDSIGPLKLRKDDSNICSLGILAHMNWDLERISRGVHSTRLRTLLRQLVLYMFPERTEFTNTPDTDFFSSFI